MLEWYFFPNQTRNGSSIENSHSSDLIYASNFETNAMNTTSKEHTKWIGGLGFGVRGSEQIK